MNKAGDLSADYLRRLANQLGIDAERMAEDMESDEVAEAIARNRALAQELGINGTPAFIIGEELIPGAVELDVLLAKIAEVREKQS
jgi:protein-disulfide isomerase